MRAMPKRLLSMLSVLAMLMTMLSVLPVSADDSDTQLQDMALIKSRFAAYFLTLSMDKRYGDETQAEAYLDTVRADGSWADIDYYDQTHTANGLIWQPKIALARMLAMSMAYSDPEGAHYHDAAMLNAVQKGLEHWRSIRDANPNQADYEGPWCSNWWENGSGIGQYIYKIGNLLEKELTADNLSMICRKLERFGSTGTGQNALWQTQNALHRALLENDPAMFRKVVDQCLCANLGRSDVLSDEALMVDNSFHAHGNLMYSNGYGKSLIQDLSLWVYFLRGTSFALPQKVLDLMADYILDGNRWMIRGDLLEMGTLYQPFNQNWARQNYAVPLQRMIESDPARAAEYQILLDNLNGKRADNGLSGNKDMWTSSYMSHMRAGYGVNVRGDTAIMKSSEWRSTWPDEELGCLVFWTTAGMTTVAVDGDEYSSVLSAYDWRHLPGTTAPYYFSDRYNDFDNANDDTISVSNGQYGTFAYTYEKTDIRPKAGNDYSGATTGGKLSYFFFDDEYVALGTDIHSNHKAAIHTTINQTKAADAAVNGTTVADNTAEASYNADWVYNNKIGYIFPEQTAVKVSRQDQTGKYPSLWPEGSASADTFSLWIDQGVAPKDKSYAYIVLPNATQQQVKAYSADNPITIVANTKTVQAVRHEGLKQTQVNFYEAGSLEYAAGKTVTVDGACSLIIDESGAVPVVTLAVSNMKPAEKRIVRLNINGTATRTVFVSGETPYAGQSMTLAAGDSTLIQSGASQDGSTLGLAFDGREDTFWKAASAADSWITDDMQESMDLATLNIRWGNVYATGYDVLVSDDGESWTTAYTTDTGKGGTEQIPLQVSGRYWKLQCRTLSQNAGVEVAEIAFVDKDFALATPTYPDMTALKQAIAQPVQENLYTDDTLAAYHEALHKAKKLLVLPYATDDMVIATIDGLTAARKSLVFRDLGLTMATVKLADPVVTVHKKTFGTPWTSLDNALDLSERNLNNIYLFFTVNITAEQARSGMFSSGRIYLRSPDTNGKENSAYCTVDSLQLHEDENVLYIPLSALNKTNNAMDWSNVRSFRMYVDSVNNYDQDITFAFTDIKILDSENRVPDSPDKIALKQLLRDQRTDLTAYTLESAAAYNLLFEQGWAVYRNETAAESEVKEMLAAIRKADELLVMDEDAKVVLGTLSEGVTKSNEGHHMKVDIKADEPISTVGYDTVYVQFDIRVDTTHTAPAPSNGNWLKQVKNGQFEMGESKTAARTVVRNRIQGTQDVLPRVESWITVRQELPAELLAKGSVQSFYMFLYNDTGALGTDADGITWSDNSGVTFSVRNIRLLADKAIDPQPPVYTLGDVDENGVVNITDALMTLQAASEKITLTEAQTLAADVNANQAVTASDALQILQYATGQIAKLG